MICSLKWKERVFRIERRKLTINGLDDREFQIRSLSERFGLRSALSAVTLPPLFISIFTHYPFGDCPETLFKIPSCEIFPQLRDLEGACKSVIQYAASESCYRDSLCFF